MICVFNGLVEQFAVAYVIFFFLILLRLIILNIHSVIKLFFFIFITLFVYECTLGYYGFERWSIKCIVRLIRVTLCKRAVFLPPVFWIMIENSTVILCVCGFEISTDQHNTIQLYNNNKRVDEGRCANVIMTLFCGRPCVLKRSGKQWN